MQPDEIAREVFGVRFAAAENYREILAGRGIEWGLIGPREVERLWERHILNSVALADLMPEGVSVVDVGSGGGLPGIPLALARPDLRMTLLEPMQRRCTFLTETIDELGRTLAETVEDTPGPVGRAERAVDILVERGRAEEHDEVYDIVTCRAVGPLKRLLDWCLPLLAPGGTLLALKGASAADELRAVDKSLTKKGLRAEILSVRAHAEAEPTTAVRITRA